MTVTACYCDDCAGMMVDYIMAQRFCGAARRIMDAIESLDVETNGVMDDENDGSIERMNNDGEKGS